MKAKYSYVLTTWATGNMNPVDEGGAYRHDPSLLALSPYPPPADT